MFLTGSYLFLQLLRDLYIQTLWKADISQSKTEKMENKEREHFERKSYSSIEVGN